MNLITIKEGSSSKENRRKKWSVGRGEKREEPKIRNKKAHEIRENVLKSKQGEKKKRVLQRGVI